MAENFYPEQGGVRWNIKQLFPLVFFLLLAFPLMAQTGTVTLAWDANSATDQVTKYTVYRAQAATGPLAKIQEVTTTTAAVTGLSPGIIFPPAYRKQRLGRERAVEFSRHAAASWITCQFEGHCQRTSNVNTVTANQRRSNDVLGPPD